MPEKLYNYDASKTILTFAGIAFVGFGDDMITVTPDGNDWETVTGPDGVTVRSKTNNALARLAATLFQGSPTHDALSARRLLDLATSRGTGPIQLTNTNSTSLVRSPSAYIEAAPELTWKRNAEAWVWTFVMPRALIVPGGAVF
jgi:hypothetical protein